MFSLAIEFFPVLVWDYFQLNMVVIDINGLKLWAFIWQCDLLELKAFMDGNGLKLWAFLWQFEHLELSFMNGNVLKHFY